MLTLGELNEKLKTLDNWALEGSSITKEFSFQNFKESLEFANKVGELAERQKHHPHILILNHRVRLTLTTMPDRQLTEKDFDLAGAIDQIDK